MGEEMRAVYADGRWISLFDRLTLACSGAFVVLHFGDDYKHEEIRKVFLRPTAPCNPMSRSSAVSGNEKMSDTLSVQYRLHETAFSLSLA